MPAQQTGLDPAADPQAARRLVADLLGRLHGPPLQRAHADQPVQREEPVAGLDRTPDAGPAGRRGAIAVRPARAADIVGGVGDNEFVGGTTVKGAILAVDGVLYVTAPDNVWALDAHDGHLLWRYFWRTRGGTHIGNRGAAMWRNYLFFVTPDDY